MHNSAMEHGRMFFETYMREPYGKLVVDLGSQDVNGSLRTVSPPECTYIGVDFEAGKGVDIIIDDPYHLPFDDNSVDAVVSSSCYEHSEFFWLSFLEVIRVLKPEGLFYLNVPSNGPFHRYPVDCWRFYPDSGLALQNWARRNGTDVAMLESFVGDQRGGVWNDFVAVYVKEQCKSALYPERIQSVLDSLTNGQSYGNSKIINASTLPEDQTGVCRRVMLRLHDYRTRFENAFSRRT